MEKIKIAKWDNLKFFFIACVVLGHFLSRSDSTDLAKGITFFIYAFHMPGFVFISGLFSKHTVNEKRYDKIFSYFILFVVTKLALFAARLIGNKTPQMKLFTINDVSWYAFAIFIFYLLTIFFKQFNRLYMLAATVILACVAGYASDIGTYLSLSRIVVFYPIFLLGYYIEPEDILKITDKIYVKLISVVIILTAAIVSVIKIDNIWWLIRILKGKFPYVRLEKYTEYGAFLRLGWYIAAMLIVFAWIAVMPSVRSIFTKWGGRTMQVYVLHYIPMVMFFDVLGGEGIINAICPGYHTVAICFVSFVVTCILSVRPITILMNKLVYPRKWRDNDEKENNCNYVSA